MRLLHLLLALAVAAADEEEGYRVNTRKNRAECSRDCIRKCCETGYGLVGPICKKSVVRDEFPTYEGYDIKGLWSDENRNVSVGLMECPHKQYLLDPRKRPENEFYLQQNGTLWLPHQRKFIDGDEFCLERKIANGSLVALVCFSKLAEPAMKRTIVMKMLNIGMTISIPFLLATFLIYLAILPDRNNIHFKCQMCYVFSLMCAYLFLVCIQLINLQSAACVTMAAFCLYSFMSSFCWMNISCCDIFWTFTGKRGFGGSSNAAEMKRFAMYCSYAYGFPLILVALILGINKIEDTNAWYHPNFGFTRCWIVGGFPLFIYFYGPMGLLLLINMILFVLTALKIRQINQDTAMLRTEENKKHYESDKQRFNLYFKLLIAMGINWSLEFISWLVDYLLGAKAIKEIWYATDFCNAIYGVFIFYMFICKRTTWIMMKKRYYIFMGQPQKARVLSMRTPTNTMSETEKTNMDESTISTKV